MFRGFRSSFPRRRGIALGFLLAGSLLAGDASAQWIVKDPAAIMTMAHEYAETAKRWKEQWEHYLQQRIPLQRLQFPGASFVDSFPERAVSYGMEESCPGRGGVLSEIGEAFGQTPPAMSGNVIDEQRKLCQRIVAAENHRYNETVRMLKRMIRHQQEFQAGVEAQRAAVGSSEGALAANDNEVERFAARTDMEIDYWRTRMQAYEAYIASLEKDRARLSRRALGGNRDTANPIVGQLVQATALQTALSH